MAQAQAASPRRQLKALGSLRASESCWGPREQSLWQKKKEFLNSSGNLWNTFYSLLTFLKDGEGERMQPLHIPPPEFAHEEQCHNQEQLHETFLTGKLREY